MDPKESELFQKRIQKDDLERFSKMRFGLEANSFKISNKPDNKRQQTFTVDYKRLINGLVLTEFVPLQRKQNAYPS